MPSIALFCHFFYLQITPDQCSGCVHFVAAHTGNGISKSKKKVEDFRCKWVFVDAKSSRRCLVLPDTPPGEQTPRAREKLVDPRAEQLLKKMTAELTAAEFTGALLVKEFLKQCIAPLQACSRPLWSLRDWDDELRLHSMALTDEELNRIMHVLLERDPGELPDGFVPLYNREGGAGVAAGMPEFNEWGLVPPMNPQGPPPMVQLSSGESSNEEEGHGGSSAARAPTR
jgi:hypothetical protein